MLTLRHYETAEASQGQLNHPMHYEPHMKNQLHAKVNSEKTFSSWQQIFEKW